MIEEDRYCMDVLAQTRAVVAAIRKIEDQIIHGHLNTCVLDAFAKGNSESQQEKINEIIDVLSYSRL